MFSFRSIPIAVATFATITSAIPTASPTLNIRNNGGGFQISGVEVSGSSGVQVMGGVQEFLVIGGAADVPGAASDADLPINGCQASPAEIFKTCSDAVELVVVDVDAAVNVDGGAINVNHDLLINLLGEIVDLLQVALEDLDDIVVAELTLNGVACTAAELAEVVAGLLMHVMKAVWLILSTVGFVNIDLCSIIASIGVLMCKLLEVVFSLVDDLNIEVVALIQPFMTSLSASLPVTAGSWLSIVSTLKQLFLTSI
jgi:hypothetical protein